MNLRAPCLTSGLLLSLLQGCLVVPYKPASTLPDQRVVDSLAQGDETRQSLRAKMGPPNLLELQSIYAWEWEGDRTDILWSAGWVYGGSGGHKEGSPKVFRVLARFEGDRVIRMERDVAFYKFNTLPSDPDKVWGAWSGDRHRRRGRLLPPSECIRMERSSGLKSVLMLPEGRIFAVDAHGALWARGMGQTGPSSGLLDSVDAREGSETAVPRLAVDPSGRFVAVGFQGKVRVWDNRENCRVLDLGEPGIGPVGTSFSEIQEVVFSPNGQWLAVLGSRASVLLKTADWKAAARLAGEDKVSRAAFSPDSRRLIIQGGRFQILDAASGDLLGELADASSGSFAMQGSRLVISGVELQVVDLETGRELGRIRRPPTSSTTASELRFSSGGVCTVYTRETLEQWSLIEVERSFRAGSKRLELSGDAEVPALLDIRMVPISPASLFPWYTTTERLFSPDGQWLVDHWHPYIQILSATTLQPLGSIRITEKPEDIRIGFSGDGRLFVLTPNEIRLWNLASIQAETTPRKNPEGKGLPAKGSAMGH